MKKRLEEMTFNERIRDMNSRVKFLNHLPLPEDLKKQMITKTIQDYVFGTIDYCVGRKIYDYLNRLNRYFSRI